MLVMMHLAVTNLWIFNVLTSYIPDKFYSSQSPLSEMHDRDWYPHTIHSNFPLILVIRDQRS